MAIFFSSPSDYLEYLQKQYARIYPPGTPDGKFEEITNTQFKEFGLSVSALGQFGGYDVVIEDLKNDLFPSLNASDLQRIQSDIAIGLLPTGEANAFIARSPNGKYALVFCSGLMLLLHKYLKLVRAFVTPQEVIHCNRKNPSSLTRDDLSSYIVELLEIYRDRGVPYGPMVKLSERASVEESFILNLAELFILCHELGHYLNGDLADESSYSALPNDFEGRKYEENHDHELEYRADVVGFSLYIQSLKKRGFDSSSVELIKPLLATFNLFYGIGGGSSSTHPHPYARVCRIVEHHYGAELGQEVGKALIDPALLPAFFERR